MQIKTIMRYLLTPVRMAITLNKPTLTNKTPKQTQETRVGEAVENGEPCTAGENVNSCSRYVKQYVESSRN